VSARVPLAYLQLKQHPRRLVIAVAGIAMSTLGILCQMGFEDSLFRSATRLFQELDADLVLISPQYQFMVLPAAFTERRLYQSLSVEGVKSIASLQLGIAPFRNPVTHVDRNVYIVGVPQRTPVFVNPEWQRAVNELDQPDELLFDARSRPEFGPIAALVREGELRSEIAHRSVRIVDVFEMGASFSADGTAIATQEGFARLFPSRASGLIDIGLVHLEPGAQVEVVLENLRAALPDDVLVMTHDELKRREQIYWRGTTPAGFIFKTVLVISLIVGCVSVYQILSSDVAENLRQYSTLKAIGYSDSYFVRLTFEKAWLLTSMAYPIGFLLAGVVYLSATYLTLVPLVMTTARVIGVYVLILAAAFMAGFVAMNRLRQSDPTELFG
jgi:putative ABC transport system permease protein